MIERLFRSRCVSFYVEWTANDDEKAIAALLENEGARDVTADDVDPEHVPCGGITHAYSVFRFRIARETPVYALLSAVAMHPLVFSVSEI